MRFTVLNWNIGGAKVLEQKTRGERGEMRSKINRALLTLLTNRDSTGRDFYIGPQPDVVTLQEIVRWREPNDTEVQDLLEKKPLDQLGYNYFPFELLDSDILSSKAKWNKVKDGSDWDTDTYFAQGNAFLIKKGAPHFPVWDLSKLGEPPPRADRHFIERVHLDTGIYFGDRNTEPRAALVAHFIYDPEDRGGTIDDHARPPLDIFVVNVHLTTLMMEREGVPEIDTLASKMRFRQLEVVFNGIVSRYNSWKRGGYRQRDNPTEPGPKETFRRHSPVWIVAGDFNFTEESAEYAFIKRLNFIDTVPADRKETMWGHGTKASGVGNDPTLTLDYVFAGPKFVSFDPAIEEKGLQHNRVVHDHAVRASDHYPVLSSLELIPL